MNTYKVASKWVIMCKHWSKHKHTHRNAPYKIETQGQNQRRAKMYTFDWWYCERIGSVDAELQTCTSIIPMRYVGKYCTWTNITLNDIDTKVCTNKNTFSQSRFRFCFDVFVGRCLCAFFLSLHIYIYIISSVSDRQYINLLIPRVCCYCHSFRMLRVHKSMPIPKKQLFTSNCRHLFPMMWRNTWWQPWALLLSLSVRSSLSHTLPLCVSVFCGVEKPHLTTNFRNVWKLFENSMGFRPEVILSSPLFNNFRMLLYNSLVC